MFVDELYVWRCCMYCGVVVMCVVDICCIVIAVIGGAANVDK